MRTAIHLLLTCYYFPTTRSALTAHTHGNHPERKWAENCDLVPSLTETTSSEITRYFIRRSILARLGIVELCATILKIMRLESAAAGAIYVLVTATPVVTQCQKCSGRTALRLLCADHPRRRAAVQSKDQLTSSRTCQTRPHDVTEKHNNRCSFRAVRTTKQHNWNY